MEYGTPPVIYNGGAGREHPLAFVVAAKGDTADLVVLNPDGVGYESDVPRRAPKDYAAGGGGHTWHQP